MRLTTLGRTLAVLSITALLQSLGGTRLLSQEMTTSMPSDPTEQMLLAAKVNGLTGADIQPWHLKASFQWMDETAQ